MENIEPPMPKAMKKWRLATASTKHAGMNTSTNQRPALTHDLNGVMTRAYSRRRRQAAVAPGLAVAVNRTLSTVPGTNTRE